MKRLFIGFLLILLCAPANAAIYVEDFNTNDGGWMTGGGSYTLETSGGVGDSGYYRGERLGYSPSFQPETGDALSYANGNLEATYGNLIDFSYAGQIFQGGDQGVLHQFGSHDVGGTYTHWRKTVVEAGDLDNFRGSWKTIEFSIDTNWTDEEAIAAGWYILEGSGRGTSSWATVMENVFSDSPFYGFQSFTSGTTIAGIDNIRIASANEVPLPSAAFLLCIGILGLSGFKRNS